MYEVSCIIPTHNRWSLLLEAIDSVRHQVGARCQIIVIDDGSSDETCSQGPLLDGVDYIRLEGQGAAVARNAGLNRARAPWVAFLDDDDVWQPNKLDTQLAWMVTHRYDFSCTAYLERDTEGRQVTRRLVPEGRVPWARLLQGCFVCTPTVVVRRELLHQVGGFDESLAVAEDWDLFLRLAARMDLAYHPAPLTLARLTRREEGAHLTKDSERVWKCALRVQERYLQHPRSRVLTLLERWTVRTSMADKHLRLAMLPGTRLASHLLRALALDPLYVLRHLVATCLRATQRRFCKTSA